MESWSDIPIEPYKIKIFLDTNILCDIVGKKYSGINDTISFLNNCPFAELTTSRYVIFEFLDVRKKLLYQEEVARVKGNSHKNRKWWEFWKFFSSKTTAIDENVLVRYTEKFDNREVKFHDYKNTIIDKIDIDIETLKSLDIKSDLHILHDELLAPTKEINLHSKLSREDSIVSISSILPDNSTKEAFVVLLTRDKNFVSYFNEVDLSLIFDAHGLNAPIVEHVRDFKLTSGFRVNLTDPRDDIKLPTFLTSKLKEMIVEKNKSLFLGKTFSPTGVGFPADALCFKLQPNFLLNKNIYLTIIGVNFDFIYSVRCPVSDFYYNSPTPILEYPFSNINEVNIAFTPKDDTTGTILSLDTPIITRLREEGNLIFLNPDGI